MIDVTVLGLSTDGDNTPRLNTVFQTGVVPLDLYFPPGQFLFSGPVWSANRSVKIRGAGAEGTILAWVGDGGLTFSGDFSHRFSCSDFTMITTVEGATAPAISITSTDTVANTIGNQHKLSDLAIRPAYWAGGGYFQTGILIDGGAHGIGNVSIRDCVVQGNSALGPVLEGVRGPVLGTRGLWMKGRTYGIRLETCQLTWVDTAAEAQDQPESFQWIGSSAGAVRCGILCATNTWESQLVGTFTVERGDFAAWLRGIYLVNGWQARISGNTILNHTYPSSSFVGIDFQGNCGQNRITDNRIDPVYAQTAPSNRWGIYYHGSHGIIADTQTDRCHIGVYLPQGSGHNTVRHGRNQVGIGVLDQGSQNLLCENR